MKNQTISSYQQQACIFCPHQQSEEPADLFQMMNQALSAKHSNQANNTLTLPIDILLKIQQPNSAAEILQCITYKELTFVDSTKQEMRRFYKITQWDGKIQATTEYYKFHRDIPYVVQKHIQKILAKYYDRRREFDYKCIKKQLKQQQGVSITSIQQSETQNSYTVQQKSKYSAILNDLKQNVESKADNTMSDSNILVQICKQIGRALPRTKISDNDFQGKFYTSDKNFESYIKNVQNKSKKIFKASTIEDYFKKKSKNINVQKQSDNYFNFSKKPNLVDEADVTRKKDIKIKTKKLYPQKNEKQEKKKFVYNTNIKIQIQNALFYPNKHFKPSINFESGGYKEYDNFATTQKYTKSRKSLIGKISALNQDKYQTPLKKIYQPQQTEISTKYVKKSSTNRKGRLTSKNSKEYEDFRQFRQHYEQRQRERERSKQKFKENTYAKRSISHQNLRRPAFENQQNFMDRHLNAGTIPTKFRYENNQKSDIRTRPTSIRRGGSLQNIKRRSVTLNKYKESMEKIPFSKYSSQDIKQSKFKGISIKDLLSKKLTIQQK